MSKGAKWWHVPALAASYPPDRRTDLCTDHIRSGGLAVPLVMTRYSSPLCLACVPEAERNHRTLWDWRYAVPMVDKKGNFVSGGTTWWRRDAGGSVVPWLAPRCAPSPPAVAFAASAPAAAPIRPPHTSAQLVLL